MLISNSAALYMVANLTTSAFVFFRNIFFMHSLGHSDLGQIAMIQTIVVAVGFIQLGIINGGYRLYAGADSSSSAHVNNTVMTSLIVLSLLLLTVIALLQFFDELEFANVQAQSLWIGCIIGVATLGSNWVNNIFIAHEKLSQLSFVNLSAAMASFLIALTPAVDKLQLIMLALLFQPICILVLSMAVNAQTRPRIYIEGKLTRELIKVGFGSYCAMIVTMGNLQLERWFIIVNLGSEDMGRYYLTVVYSTVFTLIPISLLNLFFPKMVKAFDRKDKQAFNKYTRDHLLAISIYLGLVCLLTLAFLPWMLENILPSYLGQQHLIYYILPGLIVFVMFDNVVLILQSAKKMVNILSFAVIALVLNFIALTYGVKNEILSLEFIALFKTLSIIISASLIVAHLYVFRKDILF